jgi:hypothetical protein
MRVYVSVETWILRGSCTTRFGKSLFYMTVKDVGRAGSFGSVLNPKSTG